MATAIGKTHCIKCDKDKATMKCGGCLEDFCYKHLGDHRQELNKQLDEIEVNRDVFRQSLTQQIQQPNNHALIQQINKWEENSIKIIQQTAEDAKQLVLKNTSEYIQQIEKKLNELTNQLRETRQEDDFNEINLSQFEQDLAELTKELSKPSNITIQEDSTSFINRISVHLFNNDIVFNPQESIIKSNVCGTEGWTQNGVTVAGGNGRGKELNQLNGSTSVYADKDLTIYVTDCNNSRIVEWKLDATIGQVVAGGNGSGDKAHQLNHPADAILDNEKNYFIISDCFNKRVVRWPRRNGTTGETIISNIEGGGLAMDNRGSLYVSDREKNEVRRWKIGDNRGTLVAGGNGKGKNLNQLSWPTSIFVDEDYSVYISDSCNDRVMKWVAGAKTGIVVAGGEGKGNYLTQLNYPRGLTVNRFDRVFVADRRNHRIVCWPKGAKRGNIVVGGNGQGEQVNQLDNPINVSFDPEGNLYVVDFDNHRVQRFNIN